MKTTLSLILILVSTNSWAYTQTSLLCRVNQSSPREVSCDRGWTEMRNYPHIEVKVQSCLRLKSQQKVQVRIDRQEVRLKNSTDLNFQENVQGYFIECIENRPEFY